MKYFITIFFSIIISQNIQDARMLGLSGAYSTLANGYRAVGINPANINNGTSWTVNIFSSKTSFLNNFFTLILKDAIFEGLKSTMPCGNNATLSIKLRLLKRFRSATE